MSVIFFLIWVSVCFKIDERDLHTEYKLAFSVAGEFGRIAVEFLKKGSNPKIYDGAASKSYYHSFADFV